MLDKSGSAFYIRAVAYPESADKIDKAVRDAGTQVRFKRILRTRGRGFIPVHCQLSAFPEDLMRTIRIFLQHRLNPLHVYCRLCDYGVPNGFAKKVSAAYERIYRVCGLGTRGSFS